MKYHCKIIRLFDINSTFKCDQAVDKKYSEKKTSER